MSTNNSKFGHAIDNIDRNAKPIDLVLNCQIQWRIDVACLFIAAYMDIIVVGTAIGKSVNQPRITVEIKDDWFITGKQTIKIAIAQPVRMLRW